MRERYNDAPDAFSKELDESDAFEIRLNQSSPKHVRTPLSKGRDYGRGGMVRPKGACGHRTLVSDPLSRLEGGQDGFKSLVVCKAH